MHASGSLRYWQLAGAGLFAGAALLLLVILPSCTGRVHLLQGIDLVPPPSPSPSPSSSPSPWPALGVPLNFVLRGVGRCQRVHVDWGDATAGDYGGPVDFAASEAERTRTHTFTGWAGGKTVTAEGLDNCSDSGSFRTKFVTQPSFMAIGFRQPGPNTCDPVPNRPDIFPGWLIQITTKLASGSRGIDFGCPFNGCVYDADGKPGSVAPSRFPFPGFREFSLIVRIGSLVDPLHPVQIVQGGSNVQFTSTRQGRLELCVNDDYLPDNRNGYEVDIRVDQLGPTPTPTPTP